MARKSGKKYESARKQVEAKEYRLEDAIPHSELMQCVARRIVDKHMLHLIKMWPKVPVEERDEKGNKRLTGGNNDRGTEARVLPSTGVTRLPRYL